MNTKEILAESTEDDTGWMHKCGNYLLTAKVHHSVHDGLFPLSGSGQVQIQLVPYCPICHEKPSSYGAPFHPGDEEWPEVVIKQKE